MDLPVVVVAKSPKKSSTKKHGNLSLLGIAAFFIRRRSSSSSSASASSSKKALPPPEIIEPNSDWKTIVDGVRPFHHVHQIEVQEKPQLLPPKLTLLRTDSFHDVLLPPPSPPRSSADNMSRYASAEDLCSLDKSEEEGDGEKGEGGGEEGEVEGVPHEIDLKAEEFIARFYEQMRLQNSEATRDAGY